MNKSQIKIGMVLSYIYILFNTIVGIVFTPFLIRNLGDVEYGLYQMMASFASYLVIMNFGTGTVITRYVAIYIGKKDKKGEANFIAMSLIITSMLMVLICVVALIMYTQIDNIFANSLTNEQIEKSKIIYILLVINIAIVLISQAFEGIISAYEKFIVINIWHIVKITLKVMLVILLVLYGWDSIAIVLVDLLLSVLFLFFALWYVLYKLKIKIRLYKFEKTIFVDIAVFSLAIFFQSIVNQVNNNVDKTILGIMIGPESVTIYSLAMNIFIIFSSLSTVAIPIYLPQLTKLVANGADGEKLTDAIIAPSRMQTIISGSILFGFLICGKDFIIVLMKDMKYLAAWNIAVIIMIPLFLTYINGIVVSILDALRKRMFRSILLVCMAGFNIFLSVLLIKEIGYIGAPIGTAVATFIGHVIIMNIYYKRIIGLNVKRMFSSILKGIFPCLLVASVASLPFVLLFPLGLSGLIVKGGIFVFVLTLTLYYKGLSITEKRLFIKPIRELLNINKHDISKSN